jgi:hydrogenase/urease accessory protein HupE
MEVRVSPDELSLRVTVSKEELLVAAAARGADGSSQAAQLRAHGDYLLAHITARADGRTLVGQVANPPERVGDRATYLLRYPLDRVGSRRFELSQDVLRDVEFAPGNRWEASYVTVLQVPGRPRGETRLFSFRQPITFDACPESGFPADPASRPGAWSSAPAFVLQGILHILTGYDHLLFVAALLLAVKSLGDLVKVISAFTAAHALTLTAAALDLFRLPDRVVEPVIASSIVIVAVQNVLWPGASRGRGRTAVAFVFGLFHGLGFAGGLAAAMEGMQGAATAVAIVSFSVGVEIGHQAVVLPGYFARRRLWKKDGASVADGVMLRYGSAAISVAGAWYLVAALR